MGQKAAATIGRGLVRIEGSRRALDVVAPERLQRRPPRRQRRALGRPELSMRSEVVEPQ